jgi:hypothetical protein
VRSVRQAIIRLAGRLSRDAESQIGRTGIHPHATKR